MDNFAINTSANKARVWEIWSFRGVSLRVRLMLLVTFSVLPLLIFGLALQYHQYRLHVEETGKRSMILTRSLSQVIDQKLGTYISALQVLSSSSALQQGDLKTFRARAETIIAQQFPGSSIILLRKDGQQLVNTLLPPDAPLPMRADMASTLQVFATGHPDVSDLFMARAVPRLIVAIDVPVKNPDGDVTHVLSINPRLDDFTDVIGKQFLPQSWVSAIADRKGIIVARTRNQDKFIGHAVSPPMMARLLIDHEGTVETTTLDGTPSLASFSHAETFGWSVVIAIPRAELIGPALVSAGRMLAMGGMLLIAGLLGSLAVARQVTGPMAQLRRLAISMDEDELIDPHPTGLPEADEVAQALAIAAMTRRRSEEEESRALAALHESEEKLRQSQKMEAVGQLTGGLAHDFNNLLLVIIGNLDLLLGHAPPASDIEGLARSAQEAAQHGADLTRSLLAFARRQPLRPQRTDLNSLVTRMAKLLSRTLGTHIEISLDLPLDIWPILVDPVQLEAALTNLATNARDAMPKGGRLSIATANCVFGEQQGAIDQDLVAGEYAMLQVSDNGCGMPPNILSQVFEPFFTTKAGQGTGLGLSMVFGFLKQSGGHVNAYSEVGFGTTFRLYLPRDPTQATNNGGVIAEAAIRRGGGETILVVEDLDPLRRLVMRQMDELGYRAIEAADATAALKVLDTGERVDLLFSDIVMGGKIDGLELARVVSTEWPHIKIVLTSGFPAGADPGGKQSRVDGFALLSKPYRAADLATALREALQAD